MSTSDPARALSPRAPDVEPGGNGAKHESDGSWRLALRLAWIPALAWIASAFVAEGAYRLLGVRVAGKMDGFYEPFGEGGYKHRPGAEAFMNWYSGTFSVHTDANGFRVGAASSPAGKAQDADVLVLGDSQAFGQGLDLEDSLIGVFAAAARARGLTVANGAVGGHLLGNQIELARWLVGERGLRPRAVLVCLTPRSLAEPGGYAKVFVRDGALFDRRPGALQLARRWLSSHAATYVVLRNALRGKDVSESAAYVLELYRTSLHDRRLAELLDTMAELRRALEPSRSRIVLAYLPLAAELRFDALLRKGGARFEGEVSAGEPRAIASALAKAMGVPLIDLSPNLRREMESGRPITISADSHYGIAVSRSGGEALWTAVDWRALTDRSLDP